MVLFFIFYLYNLKNEIISLLFVTCTIQFKLLKSTSYLERILQYYSPSKLVRVQISCAPYNTLIIFCGLTCFIIRGKFSRLTSLLKLKCVNHPKYMNSIVLNMKHPNTLKNTLVFFFFLIRYMKSLTLAHCLTKNKIKNKTQTFKVQKEMKHSKQ